MESACTYPGPTRNRRNHLGYSLAFPDWSLAYPNDNARVHAAGYYYGYF
jgi:hypothetical protein